MTETRVKISTIVQSQLPDYVKSDYPVAAEFLQQYYRGVEYQGAPVDLIDNIDDYIKIDNVTNLNTSVVLKNNTNSTTKTIEVDEQISPLGTYGFPDTYGLIKIGDEVITYTGKTDFTFTGCVRGFSGICDLKKEGSPEEVVFEDTNSQRHSKGDEIQNLSVLFLQEFLKKIKATYAPGFQDREFYSGINQNIFVKQSKDFYASKGTEESFKILFKVLYGENVTLLSPSEQLFRPSDANYNQVESIIVEEVIGDPSELVNLTLFQDKPTKSYAPIAYVETVGRPGLGKTYYRLDIDAGYNRNLRVDGSVYGEFKPTPKTKITTSVAVGSSHIDVDSTVGFAQTGNLFVQYGDGGSGVIYYGSKNLTQFTDTDLILRPIPRETEIADNDIFAYSGDTKVRITNILSLPSVPENNHYYRKGDIGRIKTLGIGDTGFKAVSWLTNNRSVYTVNSISVADLSDNSYIVNLNNPHYVYVGDVVEIERNDGLIVNSRIGSLINDRSLKIFADSTLDISRTYILRRNIERPAADYYQGLDNLTSNVQGVYKDNSDDSFLIASSSLPNYKILLPSHIKEVTGTFVGDTFKVNGHGFFTGDEVWYSSQKVGISSYSELYRNTVSLQTASKLFEDGLYYAYRVDGNNIKLSQSLQDLYFSLINPDQSKFISLEEPVTVAGNTIQKEQFYEKNLSTQKLIRQFNTPEEVSGIYPTRPGYTGMLLNGVEILNYKSHDNVYYGKIEDIEVTSTDKNFDVINPPNLIITDDFGSQASGALAVSGDLKEIRILDRGFDYEEPPIVSITGGNGSGAIVSVMMKAIDHQTEFDGSSSIFVNLSESGRTIGFSTYHKFRDFEVVQYKTNGQRNIVGLTTNAQYYVKSIDATTIKLYNKLSDAISGINTIRYSGLGVGKHVLRSITKKNVVEAFNIIDGGDGYQNRKTFAQPAGIQTSNNTIHIKNHGYTTGDVLKYFGSTEGTANQISGINSTTEYYVTVVDNDKFKLSETGTGTIQKDFYAKTGQFKQLSYSGVGTHTFNYPPISVTLTGKVGLASTGNETFTARVQPIFRGEITAVNIANHGVGYGVTDIINYHRKPFITFSQGKDAQLKPIVYNGGISEVIVMNSGSGYVSTPDLNIIGPGNGAILTPVMDNGRIVSIFVVEPGVGYDQDNVSVTATPPQIVSRSKFDCNIQKWKINLFTKNFDFFTLDDGILDVANKASNGIQYAHMYGPRELRKSLYSQDQNGEKLYGLTDLRFNGTELVSDNHSPIIGWAYDGNPIYGPYGYSTQEGGVAIQLKSGYRESSSILPNRPSGFPPGFFVEDFVYYKTNDISVLDENNGRYCITPEFPNGTYAYFATYQELTDSDGPFQNYKRPSFPYLIGENYHSKPNEFNLSEDSTQTEYDLNTSPYRRITSSYNFFDKNLVYPYVFLPNDLKQTISVNFTEIDEVTKVAPENGIDGEGDFYRVGDAIFFDNAQTGGRGAAARISFVRGKTVGLITNTTSVYDIEILPSKKDGDFVAISTDPQGFSNNELIQITGLSTTSNYLEGAYNIAIRPNVFTLVGLGTTTTAIEDASTTGIVTYINLINRPLIDDNIRSNDVIQINNEKMRVLNVDRESSRVKVHRERFGTTSAEHRVGTAVTVNAREFSFTAGIQTTFVSKRNKVLYFVPNESLGIGVTNDLGIGKTVVFSNPGFGITSIFVPSQRIYLKDHGLETGDIVEYNRGDGNSIVYEDTNTAVGVGTTVLDGQKLYTVKFDKDMVGFATVRVALSTEGVYVGVGSTSRGSRLVYWKETGSGILHSFKTKYPTLTGKANKNLVTVSTASTHGLSSGHSININVNPSTTKDVKVAYNDYHRKLVIDPKEFSQDAVNELNDSITIINHGLKTGDKVIHTSEYPVTATTNNGIFYVVRINADKFHLSETQYDALSSVPTPVGLASTSGTIAAVNPKIDTNGNRFIRFDLSDPSLAYQASLNSKKPAFRFDIFGDKNFDRRWEKSTVRDDRLNYTIGGVVGVDGSATLRFDRETPEFLYYNLVPLNPPNETIPEQKSGYKFDMEVPKGGEILSTKSQFSGRHVSTVIGITSFTYNLPDKPERDSYRPREASLSYVTDCTHTNGPIAQIDVTNTGSGYVTSPGIATVITQNGERAILEVIGDNIGAIKKLAIDDFGYNFPYDNTLTPTIYYPQIFKIDPFASLARVGISSFGRGYTTEPNLIVLDGITKKPVDDIKLRFNFESNQVEILQNTYGINDAPPTIIPVEGGNGVRVSNLQFNQTTQRVTATLKPFYSAGEEFPFAVGDKVLAEGFVTEGIAAGIGTDLKGYNSNDFDYKLFEVVEIDPNFGGIDPTVTYDMSPALITGQVLGTYDQVNSIATLTNEKDLMTFKVDLQNNKFIPEEIVKSNGSTGIVDGWDSKRSIVRISSTDEFKSGEILVGQTSKSRGQLGELKSNFIADCKFGASIQNTKGFKTEAGFLNRNLQKIQNSKYYQNFSYSLKSRVPYEVWNDPISSLNHPVGYQKYSDHQIESTAGRNDTISGNESVLIAIKEFTTEVDINCVNYFDMVTEDAFAAQNGGLVSKEIIFNSKIIKRYQESINNRVLLIDDISSQFSHRPRTEEFVNVNKFDLDDIRAQRYFFLIRDKRFTSQRQMSTVDIIHDNNLGYINQYAILDTVGELGFFDFTVDSGEGIIRFYPNPAYVLNNDFDIVYLSYQLDDAISGVGSTSIGSLVHVNTFSTPFQAGVTTTIVSMGTSSTTQKIFLCVNPDTGETNTEFAMNTLTVVSNGVDKIEASSYGMLDTSLDDRVSSGFGTFSPIINGSNIDLQFHPSSVGVGTTGVINAIVVALADSSYTGVQTITNPHGDTTANTTTIAASGTPTATQIASYTFVPDNDEIHGCKYNIQVADTTNNEYMSVEMSAIDTINAIGIASDVYITEYAETYTGSAGLGTFDARVRDFLHVDILFTPNPGINIVTNALQSKLEIGADLVEPSIVPLGDNKNIKRDSTTYLGTLNDVRVSFPIKHKGLRVFERVFDGSDPNIVDVDQNIIKIPNHYFTTGEKVLYSRFNVNDVTSSIGIAQSTFSGIGATEYLPDATESEVYIVRVTDEEIRLAASAADAQAPVPRTLDLTTVGTGVSHKFVTTNQDARVMITVDNIIQSPIVSTAVTTALAEQMLTTKDFVRVSGITSFFSADFIKINNEIMKIASIGIATDPNVFRVQRGRVGTDLEVHGIGSTVFKVAGNYTINDSVLNFVEPPFGITPLPGNDPDEQDWTGIATGSSFHGRVFMRGPVGGAQTHSYEKNKIFDDVAPKFDGFESQFALTSDSQNVSGYTNDNAVLLINGIFQPPGLQVANSAVYRITEPSSGISSASFYGDRLAIGYDVGVSSFPRGGVIQAIGTTEGLGYQPLIGAGGTAIVSLGGTIESVSVANTGSGYRVANNYDILTDINHPIPVGFQTIYLENQNSVLGILSAYSETGTFSDHGARIAISTYMFPTPITAVGDTYVEIGIGATTGIPITSGSQVSIGITTPQLGFVNIDALIEYADVLSATYNPVTGISTITLDGEYGFEVGETIRFADGSFKFKCSSDNFQTVKSYPRPTDPTYRRPVTINVATRDTIEVNLGTSPRVYYTPTDATYDSATGILVLTIGSHNLLPTQGVSLATDSLTFTCSKDGNTTNHTYPRATDPAAGRTIDIISVTSTTITLNVGASSADDQYAHTFVSAASNALIAGGQYIHQWTGGISRKAILREGTNNRVHVGFSTIITGTGHISTASSITNPGYGFSTGVVFEGPRAYDNLPLIYSNDNGIVGPGTEATISIVVGQGSSIIDADMRNNGYSYGNNEILTVETGGLTGIPTTGSFKEFQVTIERVHGDRFNGWSIGQIQPLDSVESYIDGRRRIFPLFYQGESYTILAARGSNIDIEQTLLVFVNDVLQIPNVSYIFRGGSRIFFTEPLTVGDSLRIYFYRGNGVSDVIDRDVIQTIKEGDVVRIQSDERDLNENPRTVSEVLSSEVAETVPYYGPGNVNDPNLLRPLVWCKQTEDKFVQDNLITKDRTFYEPVINPMGNLIKNVGAADSIFYLDSVRPAFDSNLESPVNRSFQNKVTILSKNSTVAASATAIVSAAGTISSFDVTNGGSGITTAFVSVASTVGFGTGPGTATGSVVLSGGQVSSINVVNPGAGYTRSNPPAVLITPPTTTFENCDVFSYTGDEGRIVGFATTSVSSEFRMVFDLMIPSPSLIFDTTDIITGGGIVSVTNMEVGDYFVVNNSNVGVASTSIQSLDSSGTVIGIGTEYFDNVYEVRAIHQEQVEVGGITTSVKRVHVRVEDNFPEGYDFTANSGMTTSSLYFGNYTWGKVIISLRTGSSEYTAQTMSGVGGLSTSSTVNRFEELRFANYTVQ